jgi:hypothetical protein
MKILAVISNHGLGHLAQIAPILNALRDLQPDLELTLWSGISPNLLRSRIEPPFEHRHSIADIGLIMHDAMHVDLAASHAAYQAFHADWPQRVKLEADWMRSHQFDCVVSDVAYLPLAAAAQAGIDGVALCSLNWADIAQTYLAEMPGMTSILHEIHDAYATATAFLQPTPSMPMRVLNNRVQIPAIAALGRNHRQHLLEKFALLTATSTKLALIGFGGVAYQRQGALPIIDNLVWLVPDDWLAGEMSARNDVISFSQTELEFIDLMASVDVIITKVGYGSFVEACAHALPVLYLDRPDWPETPYLTSWLIEHGNAVAIDAQTLFSTQLETHLLALWQQPRKPAIRADGAAQTARLLLTRQFEFRT